MADKETKDQADNKSKALRQTIGRMTIRVGRKIESADDALGTKLAAALAILNQAQTMADVDSRIARRLLDQARRISNTR